MKKQLITLALAGAMAGMGYADTIFNVAGGDLANAANWSAGLPNNNVGTVAINAVVSGNISAASWGTFTLNHTAGTISGLNYNINGNTNGVVHQSGGSVAMSGTVWANKVDYLLSGGSISADNVRAANGAEFSQTGGTVSARQYRLRANSPITLTGGSATLTDANEAFDFEASTPTLTIGGDFSADITAAASLIGGVSGGSVNFAADWAGSFTKSGTSSIDWEADLTSGDVSVGGTTITAGNFGDYFEISGDGNTLTIPEPATLGLVAISGVATLFIRRRLML